MQRLTSSRHSNDFIRFGRLYRCIALCVGTLLGAFLIQAETPQFTPDQIQFFEQEIRPLLANHCFDCHGDDKQKGGLRLNRYTTLLAGGDSGPVITPGDIEASPLIEAVRYRNSDFQMPPKKKLSDRQIELLEQWVTIGAPWPHDSASDNSHESAFTREFSITDEDRNYWAFQPIKRPTPPALHSDVRTQSPIDHFVLARLQENGLTPVSQAPRKQLIRRAYFDLIGLPPTYEEIQTFEKDSRPDAFSRLIDQLLASPQYGERWGRHWLDVVRFAQTNGYERDDEKPLAWKYRDYVIESFNQDKPYNAFVREQLAGDELDNVTPASLTATGFYRLGVWDDEPDDRRAAEYDGLDDMVRTTSETFLGLTIGCARCHDHMFDPISQENYYELLSFFRNIRYYDRPRFEADSPTYVPLVSPQVFHDWSQKLESLRTAHQELRKKTLAEARVKWQATTKAKLTTLEIQAWEKAPVERSPDEAKIADKIKKRLEPSDSKLIDSLASAEREALDQREQAVKEFAANTPWRKDQYALTVRENGPTPPPTQILIRGNAGRPGREVSPKFPTILAALGAKKETIPPQRFSSGRRRALAEWIASGSHPLTARVIVNRIWQHHFGRGLVATPNDFGRSGVPPTHPRLLDWLADEFVRQGWSTKRLHKTIMLSDTYQRASASTPSNEAVDPGNTFLWRQNMRRLEAESLRDAILATAGTLNHAMGGRGFFPILSGEVVAGGSRPGRGWGYSETSERHRRSVYTFIKRTMGVPLLEVFDYSNTEGSLGARTTTTVAPQALTLLNDEFVSRQATQLANQIWEDHGNHPDALVATAFRRILAKAPSPAEHRLARTFLTEQTVAQAEIADHLTFRPDVPGALERNYRNALAGDRFLVSPNDNWQTFKGQWGSEYEGILDVNPTQGPFALWRARTFGTLTATGKLWIDPATTHTGLLVQAAPFQTSFAGLECHINHEDGSVSLVKQHAERTTLAQDTIQLPRAQWLSFRLTVDEGSISFDLPDQDFRLEADDDWAGKSEGYFGVRSWGGGTRLAKLNLTSDNTTYNLKTAKLKLPAHRIATHPGSPEQKTASGESKRSDANDQRGQPEFTYRATNLINTHHRPEPNHAERAALRELCSLLFNLNEFIYVD